MSYTYRLDYGHGWEQMRLLSETVESIYPSFLLEVMVKKRKWTVISFSL